MIPQTGVFKCMTFDEMVENPAKIPIIKVNAIKYWRFSEKEGTTMNVP